MNKAVRILITKIRTMAYLYLALPMIAFLLGWLRPLFAVPFSVLFILALLMIIRDMYGHRLMFFCKNVAASDVVPKDRYVDISVMAFILMIIAVMIWVGYCGIGGLVWQRSDWHMRNATFRDLIEYRWPVVYADGMGLVYYIGFWIIPALFGKAAIAFTGDHDTAWTVGNVALYIWAVIGIVLVVLLFYDCLSEYVRQSGKLLTFTMVMLVFFAGLNLFGQILLTLRGKGRIDMYSVYGWSYYQYTPNTALIEWVFNQSIPAWVGAVLYLHARREKNLSQYGMIMMLLLPGSPFPAVGLMPLMVADIIVFKCRRLFALPNILSVIAVFPAFLLYYSASVVAVGIDTKDGTALSATTGVGLYTNGRQFGLWVLCLVIGFAMIECGIYALLIWKENYRDHLFVVNILWLFVIPFLKIGNTRDFIMRGSIIPLFVLMVYLSKAVLTGLKSKKMSRVRYAALCICLCIGTQAAICDFIITARNTFDPSIDNVADMLGSVNHYSRDVYYDEGYASYLVIDAGERSFYRLLAKNRGGSEE